MQGGGAGGVSSSTVPLAACWSPGELSMGLPDSPAIRTPRVLGPIEILPWMMQGQSQGKAGGPTGAHGGVKSHGLGWDLAGTGHFLHLTEALLCVRVRPPCVDGAGSPLSVGWSPPLPGSAGGRAATALAAGCFHCRAVWHSGANMSYQQEGSVHRIPCLPFGFSALSCSSLHNGTGGRQGWLPGGPRNACP